MKFKRLKILVLSVQAPPETFIWSMLKEVALLGDVEIGIGICTPCFSKLPQTSPGLCWIRLPSWKQSFAFRALDFLRGFSRVFFYPGDIVALIKLALEKTKKKGNAPFREIFREIYRLLPFAGLRPDIVHFQWNSVSVEYSALFDFWDCPFVTSCRGSQVYIAPHNLQRPEIRSGLPFAFSRSVVVHGVCQNILDEATAYGLNPAKGSVIYSGVDTVLFKPGEKKETKAPLKIVSVGSLRWVKGWETALVALRNLLDVGVTACLEIIGEGPDLQRLLYTIYDLDLMPYVTLRGVLSPYEIYEMLRQADIFISSSLSEGISNAVLEAMACGLSVISTDVGGMREAITDGVEGFLIQPWNAEDMSLKLQRLASDATLRRQMGEAGRRRIEKQFNLKKQAREFLELYKKLVHS